MDAIDGKAFLGPQSYWQVVEHEEFFQAALLGTQEPYEQIVGR